MKVLIVSHNPVSTYNGMGKTIATFFSEFEKTELCQFYIYPSLPDLDICNSYYRVTDKDVLRSLVTFSAPGGKVPADQIGGAPAVFEDANDQKIYTNKYTTRQCFCIPLNFPTFQTCFARSILPIKKPCAP